MMKYLECEALWHLSLLEHRSNKLIELSPKPSANTQHNNIHHLESLKTAVCPEPPGVLADFKTQTKGHNSGACWILSYSLSSVNSL